MWFGNIRPAADVRARLCPCYSSLLRDILPLDISCTYSDDVSFKQQC